MTAQIVRILNSAILIALGLLLFAGTCLAAKAPESIAGFKLGEQVSKYKDEIVEKSATTLWNREYVSRVEVEDVPGFRYGYLTYGNCAHPGRVERIKLSYRDSSVKFFERLLGLLKKRYGSDPQWRGDAFGTLRTWKWGLENENGESVSIILMHYTGDNDEYTEGNSIRIANRTWMDEELECQRKKGDSAMQKKPESPEMPTDIEWYLPH